MDVSAGPAKAVKAAVFDLPPGLPIAVKFAYVRKQHVHHMMLKLPTFHFPACPSMVPRVGVMDLPAGLEKDVQSN